MVDPLGTKLGQVAYALVYAGIRAWVDTAEDRAKASLIKARLADNAPEAKGFDDTIAKGQQDGTIPTRGDVGL